MRTLLAFPFFALLVMIQTSVVARLPLLRGFPDLILLAIVAWSLNDRVKVAWQWTLVAALLVGYVSAAPSFVPAAAYLATTALARILQRQIWKTPVLAMFLTTFWGTIIYHGLSYASLQIFGTPFSILDSLDNIIIPSALLNLVLALPMYALMKEIADLLYPVQLTT